MIRLLPRRVYDLDRPIQETELDPMDETWVDEFFRHTLQFMLTDGLYGLHWFYHEAADCVRCCLWSPDQSGSGTWQERCPVSSTGGRKLLRKLRRDARVKSRDGSRIWGVVYYRWRGLVGTLNLDSPHEWDARLWRGTKPSPALSYELVFNGPPPGPSNGLSSAS